MASRGTYVNERTGVCDMQKDIIYKQAAVELAMKYCPDDDGAVQCDGDIRGFLDELENLPSAQPEVLVHGEGELIAQPEQICVATVTLTDEQVKEVIKKTKNAVISAIEPEPHEGHWIGGDGSYICSECGGNPMDFIDTMGISFDAYIETPMKFCPHCGADMRRF